jgi:uncharacterized membrane protein YqgA involved in biofilm formation
VIAVIINGAATALGAMLGVILKKGVPEHVSKAVFSAIGLCLAVMAIQGAVQTENILLMVLSIAIGVAVGTILSIEDRMQSFGLWLRNRMKAGGDSNFVEAFVTLSVMQVVGAMAILGPIQAALLGDTTLLYLKSTIDGISAFIFGALYGAGAVPVGIVIIVYELAVYAAASLLSPLTHDAGRHPRAQRRRQRHDPGHCLEHDGLDKAQGGRLYAGDGHSYYIL